MIPILIQRVGWWWPAIDTDAHIIIPADCAPDIAALLPHVPGRDLIVQAGSNVGIYPVALADHFQRVITAEPDPANWACTEKNLAVRDSLRRVEAHNAAFGEAPGLCAPVAIKPANVGAHRVEFGEGAVKVITIDSLDLPACDCIWLDLEGSELLALKGAEQTIERFSPVLAVEDKGLNRAFGIEPGALQAWLAERGYEQIARFGRDKVFARRAA